MVALAAVINTSQPAATALPTLPATTSLKEQTALTAQAEILEEAPQEALAAMETPVKEGSVKTVKAVVTPTNKGTEAAVRAYFADIPIMIQIARCESRFRQYAADGEVIRGKVNYLDRGVMQINEYYHAETAEKLGIDILTLEGNMEYARYLYEKQGTRPWISSSPCWSGSMQNEIAQN